MQEYQYSARFYDPVLSPWVRPIRHRIAAIVRRYQYRRILDVCCGTGEQLKILRDHGFEGRGIDLSEAMLEVARKGPNGVDCALGDATEMAYADKSFDLTMTAFALHEKSHKSARKILEEMVRLTDEGGDIIIVDYELSDQTSRLYKMLIYLIEWIAGGEHYRNFKAYLEEGGLPALLLDLPLKELRRYYFGKHGIVLLLLRKNTMKPNKKNYARMPGNTMEKREI